MSVADLEILFEQKRASMRNEAIECQTVVGKTGFVDNAHGAVLPLDRALELLRQKHRMNDRPPTASLVISLQKDNELQPGQTRASHVDTVAIIVAQDVLNEVDDGGHGAFRPGRSPTS